MSEEKLEKYWNKVYYDYLEQEEAKELIDYYKNMEQENKQLKERFETLTQEHIDTINRNEEKQQRIQEAIEYIKKNSYGWETKYYDDDFNANELLEILGGE